MSVNACTMKSKLVFIPNPPVITVTLTPIGFPNTLNCSAIWKANSLECTNVTNECIV